MLNVAIIGCGGISTVHADAIEKNEEAILSAVVDIDLPKTKYYKEKYNCKVYTDYKEMLQDKNIDVVHICTPHYLHCEMILECIKARKHVLTEKPLCISKDEIKTITDATLKSNTKVGVCFQNRYNKTSKILKEYLDSGRGGEVKGAKAIITWHRYKEYYLSSPWKGKWTTEGGGVLINQAIHTIDLLIWFLGDILFVEGSISTRLIEDFIEVENTAEGILHFKSGVNALIYATNCYCVDSQVEIEIVCENAIIKLGNELMIHEKELEPQFFYNETSDCPGKDYWGQSHKLLIDDFYDSILSHKNFKLTPTEGGKAVSAVLDFYSK